MEHAIHCASWAFVTKMGPKLMASIKSALSSRRAIDDNEDNEDNDNLHSIDLLLTPPMILPMLKISIPPTCSARF
jgi:hypothetical protein